MSEIFNKAIPVVPSEDVIAHVGATPDDERKKHFNRSLAAKKRWEKRRADAVVANTPRPPVQMSLTVQEAIQLARLIVDYPFLRRLLE